MAAEQDIVIRCMKILCAQAGFPDCNSMVQRDFEFLSESIASQTGVRISLSTIKRLLHGQFSRFPQLATLNAISQYVGYENWRDFKTKQKPAREVLGRDSLIHRFRPHKYFISGGLILVVIISMFALLRFTKSQTKSFDKAEFSAHKTTGNEIPNTVVFDYNIDAIEADSFFIQQSWDKNRRVQIFKNHYSVTDIYYEPGYHVAKLIANDQVIQTVDVSIPTDQWFLYAKEKFGGHQLEYIRVAQAVHDGYLGLGLDDLEKNGISYQAERMYAYTFFPSKIDVSSDNYTFKTRIRVNELRNNACPYVMMEVFCQNNFNFFGATPKGCAGDSFLQFGENKVSGKDADLSQLGYDISQWMNVEVTVRDKHVSIRFNEKEVYAIDYTQSSKLITGLGFFSNGLCEIDFIELRGLDGEVVYESDFSEEIEFANVDAN